MHSLPPRRVSMVAGAVLYWDKHMSSNKRLRQYTISVEQVPQELRRRRASRRASPSGFSFPNAPQSGIAACVAVRARLAGYRGVVSRACASNPALRRHPYSLKEAHDNHYRGRSGP